MVAETIESGFQYHTYYGCQSNFTKPRTAITAYTQDGTDYWDVSGLKNTTTVPSGIVRARGISVFWRASDLSKFPP